MRMEDNVRLEDIVRQQISGRDLHSRCDHEEQVESSTVADSIENAK
jgi:hypothetical protein